MWGRRYRGLLTTTIAAAALALLPGIAGASSVKGDFNGDGHADLAVGVPGQTVAGQPFWGSVHVIYGSGKGLAPKGDKVIKIELPGTDEFGITLAAGDFNGDGRADLAVGAPFSTVDGATGAGYVAVLYGTKQGLPLHSAQLLAQGADGLTGSPDQQDQFGHALAAADFGRGHQDDLAIGVPGQDDVLTDGAGEVDVLYGSPSGLKPATGQSFSKATPGVPGPIQSGDAFGRALAAGNMGRGGTSDLAVAAPDASQSVDLLFGSSSGVTTKGARLFSRDTPGIAGGLQPGDGFGFSLAVGDFGRGARADLAVGAPFETVGGLAFAGAVNVLYSGKHGPRTSDDRLLTLDSPGVAGRAKEGDAFGRELAAGNVGRGGHADLVSAVSDRDTHGLLDTGAVSLVYGSNQGLRDPQSEFFDRSTKGIAGSPGQLDYFGFALAIGAFGNGGGPGLAVGAPGAEVGAVTGAGSVNVLHPTRHGLRGSKLLVEGKEGLAGKAEPGDSFGSALSHRSSTGVFD